MDELKQIIDDYDLLMSLHCKLILPKEIVNKIMCINLHPGYNPYNRGMFPYSFSIINNLPAGATLHVMDEKIDNGPIIDRLQVNMDTWDTMETLYDKVLIAEKNLLENNIVNVLNKDFTYFEEINGNINTNDYFKQMNKIDLKEIVTMQQAIDFLRSRSHQKCNNLYFIDNNNNKVYVKIQLIKERDL